MNTSNPLWERYDREYIERYYAEKKDVPAIPARLDSTTRIGQAMVIATKRERKA